MTTTTLTARSLLDSGDPEFACWIRHWVEHREPPLPFADWLRERGLEGAARAVEWVVSQPVRPTWLACQAGFRTSKPFPSYYKTGMCGLVTDRAAIQISGYSNADLVSGLRPQRLDSWHMLCDSVESALVYILDNLEVP